MKDYLKLNLLSNVNFYISPSFIMSQGLICHLYKNVKDWFSITFCQELNWAARKFWGTKMGFKGT